MEINNCYVSSQLCDGLIFFTGGSEWKVIAERLGFNQAYIRCFDNRYRNPLEVVLSCCHLSVGELYDILVECELPVLADFLQERRLVRGLVIDLWFGYLVLILYNHVKIEYPDQ